MGNKAAEAAQVGNPTEGAAPLPCPLAAQRLQATSHTLVPWVPAVLLGKLNNQPHKEHRPQ